MTHVKALWTVLFATLFASLLAAFALPQTSPTLQLRGTQRPAHAAVLAGPTDLGVKSGTRISLFVDVTPNPNIHVYAPGTKDFIPITVKVEAQPAIKVGKTTYPKSETMTFADEKVPVFQKPFRLTQEVTINGSVKPGTMLPIAGTVNYQACDDKVCYPPETAPVAWTVTVR